MTGKPWSRARQPSRLFRLVTAAYRRGSLPNRGTGALFDRTPARLWGGHTLRVQTDAGPMVLPLREHGARQLLVFGRILLEHNETRVAARILRHASCFVDIGASYGFYSALAATASPLNISVIAVEPNSRLWPYLGDNIARGHLAKVMMGDHRGTAALYTAKNSVFSSPTRPVGQPESVRVETLDALATNLNLHPDFVKCDVEGGELAVLRGARNVLHGPRAPIWMIEVDEELQTESGSSIEALEREFGMAGPGHFLVASHDGTLIPITSLCEARAFHTRNVFYFPSCRIELMKLLMAAE